LLVKIKDMKKLLVIGGGFGGCTAIHEFSKKSNWEITLAEPSKKLGGGVRTNFKSGHPYTFGPRHFLTQNESVYKYLSSYLELRLCKEHQFISYVADDGEFYNYPIHYEDIPRMPDARIVNKEIEDLEMSFKNAQFNLTTGSPKLENTASDYEDFWIRSVGPSLYKKFIEKYTKKMWQIDDNKLIDDFSWSPKGVAIKKGPREGWDTAISAYPLAIDGYNKFFDSALEKCDRRFEGYVESIKEKSLTAKMGDEEFTFDLIINTSPLDELYNSKYGKLRYIGRRIEFAILPVEYCLPKNVYFAYYTGEEDYTRIVEYKKFSKYKSPHTLISLEYPTLNQGKYYPMPTEKYRNLHQQYLDICHTSFINVGRLAKYNYRYDIDDVIEQVLEISDNLTS